MSRKGDVLLLFTCGEEISEGNGGQRVERHNGGWAVTMTVEAWVGLLSPLRLLALACLYCVVWDRAVDVPRYFWEESKVQKIWR